MLLVSWRCFLKYCESNKSLSLCLYLPNLRARFLLCSDTFFPSSIVAEAVFYKTQVEYVTFLIKSPFCYVCSQRWNCHGQVSQFSTWLSNPNERTLVHHRDLKVDRFRHKQMSCLVNHKFWFNTCHFYSQWVKEIGEKKESNINIFIFPP